MIVDVALGVALGIGLARVVRVAACVLWTQALGAWLIAKWPMERRLPGWWFVLAALMTGVDPRG